MPIADLPLFNMLRTRMHWHQERQRLLSENVGRAILRRWISSAPRRGRLRSRSSGRSRAKSAALPAPAAGSKPLASAATTCPSGKAVNLEDEMIKVAANQMDYQAATTLYTRSLGLIKTAIGKR